MCHNLLIFKYIFGVQKMVHHGFMSAPHLGVYNLVPLEGYTRLPEEDPYRWSQSFQHFQMITLYR